MMESNKTLTEKFEFRDVRAEEARAIAKEAREQLKILAPAMVQRAANTPVEV